MTDESQPTYIHRTGTWRDSGVQSFSEYRDTSFAYPVESSGEENSFHEPLDQIEEEIEITVAERAPIDTVEQSANYPAPRPSTSRVSRRPPQSPHQSPPSTINQLPQGGEEQERDSDDSDDDNSSSDDSVIPTDSDSESNYLNSLSSLSSDEEMAGVGGRYVTVPLFSAKPGEEADQWLERFEEAASYNGWSDEKTLRSVYMTLDGAAKAWGKRLRASANRPTVWSSVAVAEAATVAARMNDPAAPAIAVGPHGFREFFVEEFITAAQHVDIGIKLKRCVQSAGEPPVNYFHDVMALCDQKNPNMSDAERLEYFFAGLEQELRAMVSRQNELFARQEEMVL